MGLALPTGFLWGLQGNTDGNQPECACTSLHTLTHSYSLEWCDCKIFFTFLCVYACVCVFNFF